MAHATYRSTFKSREQRSASQPNIIELDFASDDDAIAFGTNAALVIGAKLVSVDKVLSKDYALPYPDGKNAMTRTAITDGAGGWQQVRIYDTPDAFAPITRQAALIASGFLLDPYATVPTSVTSQTFTPGEST
jgi:hypothetical protein